MGLFVNDLVPTRESVVGDIVEADFSGYAIVPVVYAAAIIDELLEVAVAVADPIDFAHDGGGVANLVFGWYITVNMDSEGTTLWLAERFPLAPRSFAAVGDVITISHSIRSSQVA